MSAYKKSVFSLLSIEKIVIPDYQRPYKWTKRNIEELLSDISRAIEDSNHYSDEYKYRVGTIIFHIDEDGNYNIVDGQQRIISLLLLLLCLDPSFKCDLLSRKFTNEETQQNIHDNYMSIRQWLSIKGKEACDLILNALKNIIEVVVIEVSEESEAFQLFDSQNSRGKALNPHDLLKAYHLREMISNLSEMEHAVKKWEDEDPNDIKALFGDYLFPICNWVRRMKTDTFSDKKIDVFKGATIKDNYSFAMRAFKASPYFQINEPFIAGSDFFEYVKHYLQMLSDIKKALQEQYPDIWFYADTNPKTSDPKLKYCRQLFYCVLMCYYDRFHMFDTLSVYKLFSWSYLIRLEMDHLGFSTINNYAIGDERYYNIEPVFSNIANARKFTDISNMAISCEMCQYCDESDYNGLPKLILTINGLH